MFLCGADSGDVHKEELERAVPGGRQCQGHDQERVGEARGDVNDCRFDLARARTARQAEMEYCRKMKVYGKVPVQKRKGTTGKAPTRVRWADTHKQGERNPKYRSRPVAKCFKRRAHPDLYTATPPILLLRSLMSSAATRGSRAGRRRKLMANAMARAYLNAPSRTPTFVKICEEAQDPANESMCGELRVDVRHKAGGAELAAMRHRLAREQRLRCQARFHVHVSTFR